MPHFVCIALSGGIDSLVSAFLLNKNGYKVVGVHFLINDCRLPIESMASQLNIPINIIDIRQTFKQHVIDYFVQMYQQGKTPSPCLVCNHKIKFGLLLDYAISRGATHMATGHYAAVEKDLNGVYHLKKGKDPVKDQSYFLSRLTQAQLSRAMFPLSNLSKDQVRNIASEYQLKPITQSESQDVCFIENKDYATFLSKQPEFKSDSGLIVDLNGKVIGNHAGLHHFTIGQRKGINCPGPRAYFVNKLDTEKNQLIVGYKEDLLSKDFFAEDVNWIQSPPQQPLRILTRIRYRHTAAISTLFPVNHHVDMVRVVFDDPQESITPGQAAVFYQHDEVIGSGWITHNN